MDIDTKTLLEELKQLREQRTPCALCTVVEAQGSAPRRAGAKMIVKLEGANIGTIGGGAIEHKVIEEAIEAIGRGEARLVDHKLTAELGMACGGEMKVFIEPQSYAPRMVIFGGGHVGAAVCDMAASLGYEITVVDARDEWSAPQRFPRAAEVIQGDPIETVAKLRWDPQTFALVMTHSHDIDFEILKELLGFPFGYLGVIASVRKREVFRKELRTLGYSEEQVLSFHSPLGLDIGAVTPAEIAISVLAELVQLRRGRLGSEAVPMSLLSPQVKRKARIE